ncbi:hypothetical protein SAMN05442782_9504 [Streptomyces sp. OK228]|nr:hypothetical protein SAMN05442782_9504 [Streptomyces sp. OK228]
MGWAKLRRGWGRAPALRTLWEPDGTRVNWRAVREECRALLAQMPILRPLSLERLISTIKTARGWRIKLVAIPNHTLANIDVRGPRLRLDGAPVVLIVPVEDTTGFHRPRIILHELAHLWCDNMIGASFDQLARPLPDVPPAVLRRPTNKGRVVACRHDGHLLRGRLIALCRGFRARLADFLVDEYQQLRRQPFSLAPASGDRRDLATQHQRLRDAPLAIGIVGPEHEGCGVERLRECVDLLVRRARHDDGPQLVHQAFPHGRPPRPGLADGSDLCIRQRGRHQAQKINDLVGKLLMRRRSVLADGFRGSWLVRPLPWSRHVPTVAACWIRHADAAAYRTHFGQVGMASHEL